MSMHAAPVLAAELAEAPMAAPDPEVPERATRRIYSARYKARILDEYGRLDARGRGALLRREGLYSSHISKWRKLRDRGALTALAATPGRPAADPSSRGRSAPPSGLRCWGCCTPSASWTRRRPASMPPCWTRGATSARCQP